jgi:spore germination cell wall hydrolase CwlJ-like protein
MFSTLLYNARSWPLVWRSRLLLYWFTSRKEGFAFFAMLALPFIALGSFVYFAYADQLGARIEVARQRATDLRCLAENIYFEARGEPLVGQYAVAEVTLNRVASPFFPDTICEVVHEARWDPLRRRMVAAFSWTELGTARSPRGAAWREAKSAATAVYDRTQTPVVPGALYYHATSIQPTWARTKKSVAKIGNHIFYR